MALTFGASVSRTLLSLADLDINDSVNYLVGNQILGSGVSWERKQVSSPWVDGDFTVTRRRPNVSDKIEVRVYGGDQEELKDNLESLVEAMTQDNFILNLTLDAQSYSYSCESADYQISWGKELRHSNQTIVTFQIPRKPVALAGI